MTKPGNEPCRRAGTASIAALALTWSLLAAGAAEAAIQPAGGVLSPRLAELAKPSVGEAPQATQAKELALPVQGPGSLLREGNRVLVEVRFDQAAGVGAEDLRAAGAKVLDSSSHYQTATVAAKPGEMRALSSVPGVAAAREVLTPTVSESTCPSGAVVSEGLTQLRAGVGAGEVRSEFPGVDGAGVKVGILSDSFNRATKAATHATKDIETGDLPGPANTCSGQSTSVEVLNDSDAEGEDEGRAMAQIVHDLAPGAALSFATAFTGITGFAGNIEALAAAGAKVIADDVTYFEEPFFQEGPVGVAATKVTEKDDVSYFSAAGNDNLIDGPGNDIASWEAPQFRDSGGCPAAIHAFEAEVGAPLHPNHCMDFNPGAGTDTTFGITVSNGATLIADLQWAEPWEAVNTDLDAFLIGPEGKVVGEVGGNPNPSEGRPFELVGWENETGSAADVQLVINRYEGGSPRLKFALLENGSGVTATEYPESKGGDIVGPTIFGHSGGEDVTSVGAIPYNATAAPERYSSRGPVTHYFGPVSGATPAAPLVTPQVLSKPDVTATDCGVTTFFAFKVGANWRFCGTSAAAPHAAAVAALMLQEEPSASPEEIRRALVESAASIGSFGPCAVGAGLVNAVGAVELISSGGTGTPPGVCLPPFSGPWTEPPFEEAEEKIATANPPASPLPPFQPNFQPRPDTSIRSHPARLVRTDGRAARVVFGFSSSEPNVSFLCDVDSGPFHLCPATFVHRFGLGTHSVRVKARDQAGAVGPTATFRFQVKCRRGA